MHPRPPGTVLAISVPQQWTPAEDAAGQLDGSPGRPQRHFSHYGAWGGQHGGRPGTRSAAEVRNQLKLFKVNVSLQFCRQPGDEEAGPTLTEVCTLALINTFNFLISIGH